MTATEVITSARVYVAKDIDSTARRFSDAKCVKWLNLGLRAIHRKRPDAISQSALSTSLPTAVTVATMTAAIGLDDMYEAALI